MVPIRSNMEKIKRTISSNNALNEVTINPTPNYQPKNLYGVLVFSIT